MGFETILPDEAGGGLAWRPGAVVLGTGPHEGKVLGASFAGERREYILDSTLGTIKADVPVSAPRYELGQTVAFDLPREAAVPLARVD